MKPTGKLYAKDVMTEKQEDVCRKSFLLLSIEISTQNLEALSFKVVPFGQGFKDMILLQGTDERYNTQGNKIIGSLLSMVLN